MSEVAATPSAETELYREVYEFEADVYRITPGEEAALEHRRTLVQRLLPPDVSGPAMDVGCGDGTISNDVVQAIRGGSGGGPGAASLVLGTDVANKRASFARERTPDARFLQSSIYDLPFADGTFELVLSTDLLEHLDEPDKGFAELARVSRKYVLVSVPYSITPEKLLCPHCLKDSYLYGHQHDIGPKGVARMAEASGLEILKTEHVIPMFECRRYKWFPPLKWLIWDHFKNSGTYGALMRKR